MKKLPAFVQPVVAALKPAAMGLAVVGAGALAAQVGGGIAKTMSASVEAFAAKSVWHEAAVDAGGGVVIDAGITAGVAAVKGMPLAKRVAPLLLIGTGVSALAPAVGPWMARVTDSAVGAAGSLSGRKAAELPASAAAAPAVGGGVYGASAFSLGDGVEVGGFGLFGEVDVDDMPSSLGF